MFREKCKLEAPHGARAVLHHLIGGDEGARQHMCEKEGRELLNVALRISHLSTLLLPEKLFNTLNNQLIYLHIEYSPIQSSLKTSLL